MTALFRSWILGLAATALFCALAMAVMPKGRAGGVLRLVCGIVLTLALIAPLAEAELAGDIGAWEDALRQYGDVTAGAEQEVETLYRGIIEERCAAYIWDKAEQHGAVLTAVSVTAQWDTGVEAWLPHSMTAVLAAESDTAALSAAIAAELGIPAERQEWKLA